MQATQTRAPWRTVLRTSFQLVIALAAAWALIVEAAGIDADIPFIAASVTIAAGITRVMALPAVESILRQYLPILAATPPLDRATLDNDTLEDRTLEEQYIEALLHGSDDDAADPITFEDN